MNDILVTLAQLSVLVFVISSMLSMGLSLTIKQIMDPLRNTRLVILGESGSIYEYPLSTIRIGGMNVPVGGGGYLRLFPYTLTKWAIGKLNKIDHQPAVVYLHPWELDPGQPRLNGKRLSRFRHYVNLHKTEGVLKSLLEDFRFGAFSDLNKECIASVVGQGE